MLSQSLRMHVACALTLCTSVSLCAQESNCQSNCQFNHSTTFQAVGSDCQTGTHCLSCNHDPLFAGPSCEPYGFLWTGYDATVVYDIYGHRRFEKRVRNASMNHASMNPGSTMCKHQHGVVKGKTLFNVFGSPSRRCTRCDRSVHGVMEMMEAEDNDSQPMINNIPKPDTSESNTTMGSNSDHLPVPTSGDEPAIDLVPAEVSDTRDVSNTGDSATVRAAPPMLEAPEPTLQYAPLDTDSKIPRNVIPNRSETIESDTPKSSRRSSGTPTLKAVREMIKA